MARKVGKRDSRYLAKLVTENRAPCAFCHREVDDEVTYGKLYAIGDIQCHYLCALLSCCLVQKGPEEDGLFGFMYKDILAELERSKKHKCSFCSRGGANLGCSVASCRKQFHLPCGRERNAVSLFYGSYKSFCQMHAPRQKIPEHIMCKAKLRIKDDRKKNALMENADDTTEEMVCVICYEVVDAFPTVNTFWPPCCARDAWFHRTCLQRMALSAGMHYLKCPLCNDKENFYDAVVGQGYYVPDRDAAWELEQNAFAEIYERPLTCTADSCLCPLGRSHDADQGMWDIKLCLLCGSVGAHAQCIGASETTRYVCLTCTPAKPSDMQALADTIDKLILEEQAYSASNTRHGPVMPSRMSLRRTKGRPAILNRPSTSGAYNMKTQCESPAQAPNIQSSREELNLKTPRKLTQTDSYNSPKKLIHTDSYKSPGKKTPIKLLEQSLSPSYKKIEAKLHSPLKVLTSDSYKHTESYENLEANLLSPKKLLEQRQSLTSDLYKSTDSYKSTESYKNLEANLLSPMKLLEQSFREKIVCMGGTAILDERVVDILRRRFSKPKPLSEKRRIVDDIVNSLFNNLNSPLKQKELGRVWTSPKQCYDITEENENKGANDNDTKVTENMVENKENFLQEIPKKSKKSQNSTPVKLITTPKLNDNSFNGIERDKTSGNEKHHENEGIEEIGDEKPLTEGAQESGTHDDSSNSTFQLPSEFVAEVLSDDSITFQSPKRRTIEMKDSSLEISEKDHSVNIDVIKIPDSDSPDVKKCAFKFSRLDKEKLEEGNVGIDLESFKKGYLTEVDRQYKCCFNHKHDPKNPTPGTVNFRSVIDFAIDAHLLKKTTDNKQSKKRKLSEGSLSLSFDKNKTKKRKMSENYLNSSCSSDDFEAKKELKSPVNKVDNSNKVNVNGRNKRKKKGAKERRKERKNREKTYKDVRERDINIGSNDGNQYLEEQSLLHRKLEGKERRIRDGKEDITGKDTKNRSNIESFKQKYDKDLFNKNLEGKKQSINDRKQVVKEKQTKNKSNNENIKQNLDKSLLRRKLEGKKQRTKDMKKSIEEKQIKIINTNDGDRTLVEEKILLDVKEKIESNTQLVTTEKHLNECKEKRLDDRKMERKEQRVNVGEKHVKHKSQSNDVKKIKKYKPRVDEEEARRRKEKHNKVRKHKHSNKLEKHNKNSEKYAKDGKRNGDGNIEVTIDSSKSSSKQKTKTKLSISNNEKDISVKIKWKKKQFRLKIESKKAKAEKLEKDSKFKQYVLQYFSEVTPKEVLVKPEKEVSPLKRKYVKQEKTPDKLKQMSISNFFKVKSPTGYETGN